MVTHGLYRLLSVEPCFACRVVTPGGCQIGYTGYTGCHQLNRVLKHNDNVVKCVYLCEIAKLAKKARNERREFYTEKTVVPSPAVDEHDVLEAAQVPLRQEAVAPAPLQRPLHRRRRADDVAVV